MSTEAAAAPFTVRIEPAGWEFSTGGEQSLMAAARAAKIALPASCRNGTCRTCLCKLVSGQIRYGIDWPGVSREEKAEGYILPCVAHAESDVVLTVPHAQTLPG
ncbi:2Fe-2S iron-sulfur cluster-binding protein [Noviherbaspirillum malthae]|jgi:ferredoxin|uniref:2Fe-2S iron-sulfur cluster-binding protein n=1 Tax=Noviherbaspirillum malthae TaxID=1260987 RepID=UPI00188EA382|nr:2Fe-2S iron-sulfur cluster-binding protein [Noviherbaspirillum malthae]